MTADSPLPPGGPENPADIESAAQRRLAGQLLGLIEAPLSRMQNEALQRAFRMLDMGDTIPPDVAQAVVLELYAVEKLARRLRKQGRRGEVTQERSMRMTEEG